MNDGLSDRLFTTVILAMSVDGKIADASRAAARFGSLNDQAHLERQVAQADAVLFGAETLRAYGTTLKVSQPELLHHRQQRGQPPQPIHIVCSRSAEMDPQYRFFQQSVPRWLLTTAQGVDRWQTLPLFERILVAETAPNEINWQAAFQQFLAAGIRQLAVLGGGTLVASLLEAELIDEIWLTICPLILGGALAPTPVEGSGFLQALAPRLRLLAVQPLEQEVFLHYRVMKSELDG